LGEQTATEDNGRQPTRRAHVVATPASADHVALWLRIVDELATNDYVNPHWQAFLPSRSAFLEVPRRLGMSELYEPGALILAEMVL
jgi:hypothetical protein